MGERMTDLTKKFSFIIPIYNTGIEIIEKCICSILGQRINNFEIILVNDGSSDKVIDDFCKDLESTESGLIYIYQENQGSAVARNKGLDMATGDYIFFVDADDTLVEESFQKYLNLSEEVEITCFDYLITDGQNSTNYSLNSKMDLSNHKNRLYANIMYKPGVLDDFAFGAIWGKCFSRQFLEKNNIRFRPELRKTQDRIFMLEAFLHSSNILYLPIPFYNYHVNPNSITHVKNFKMLDYCERLINCFNDLVEQYPELKKDSKYFTYNIFQEMLLLTYLNKYSDFSSKIYVSEITKIYKRFKLDEGLREINYQDFNNSGEKIKLFLYKNRFFRVLKYYYSRVK